MDESGCTGLPHLLHLPAEICWVFTEKSSQLLLCLVVAHCPGSQEQCLRGLMQWTTYALFRLAEYTALFLQRDFLCVSCIAFVLARLLLIRNMKSQESQEKMMHQDISERTFTGQTRQVALSSPCAEGQDLSRASHLASACQSHRP